MHQTTAEHGCGHQDGRARKREMLRNFRQERKVGYDYTTSNVFSEPVISSPGVRVPALESCLTPYHCQFIPT